jgi:hypothetical protein
MKPSIGRIVIHRGILSNGTLLHPAIITRVWTDETVNLTVFPDFGPPSLQPSQTLIADPNDGDETGFGWYWPPRVEEA